MAQQTSLQVYGIPGKLHSFAPKDPATGIQTTALHIFSAATIEPNHALDNASSVLVGGDFESQNDAYMGGAANYVKIDSAGIFKSNGTAKSLNLQWDTEVFASDDTLDDENVVALVDASSNTVTITLPTAVGIQNRVYYIKATDATFAVTVATNGSQTIDNDLSWTLAGGETITIVSDNANWWII